MGKDDARSAGVDDIQFFSDVDMKYNGKESHVTGTYPAWYFDQQLADQKEELAQRTRRRAPDEIMSGDVDPEYTAETKQLEARIKEIEQARPRLNGPQKNFLMKASSELSTEISASMFTYDSMHTGEASAHEELKRQIEPCIPIDKRLATSLNLKSFRGGRVSRDDATIALQIINKSLGEESSAENLRPRLMTYRTQRITPFTGNPEMENQIGREAAPTATA